MLTPLGDFEILETAADGLHKFFRFDEDNGLKTALTVSSEKDNPLYFPQPYKSKWEPQFKNATFSAFPDAIHKDFSEVESASFMGILPELGRAWISVDNRLYLWDYDNPEVYTLYNGLSDVIVSVGLAAPKPGIFTEIVKYVLVVATTVEVVLLAVTWRDSSGGILHDIRLQNTQYTISTDNNTIFKIVSSLKGRIFLAGNDRNVYELVYENDNDSWKSLLGLDTPFKCRKVSHSNWSLVNILDPVFRIFGGIEDGLVDLAVDDSRNILYGVSSSGVLSVFYLGPDGTSVVSTTSGFDIVGEVKKSLNRSNIATMDFASLKVTSLQVVELVESSDIHLVINMNTGTRVYISVSTSYGKPVMTAQDLPLIIRAVHVRNPPTLKLLKELMVTDNGRDQGQSRSSVQTDMNSQSSAVYVAYYSHGVDVFAWSNGPNDVLVGIGTDDIIRRTAHTLSSERLRSLTEGVCVVECNPPVRKIYDIRESCPQLADQSMSALRALYACSASAPTAGSSNSSTVTAYKWDFSSSSRDQAVLPVGPPAAIPCAGWERQDIKCGLSRVDIDSGIVIPLGEQALQHGPSGAYSQRRILCLSNMGMHTLVKLRPVDYLFRMLSHSSSSTYSGDFPVDYLALVGSFFDCYGALNASAMCFGVACGLPADAGGDVLSMQATTLAVPAGLSTLQRRAISSVLRYTDSPSFSSRVGFNTHTEALQTGARSTYFTGADATSDRRVVPDASAVRFSSCHDGLYLLSSRLLRPIWHKVIIGSKQVRKNADGTDEKAYFLQLRRVDLDILAKPIIQLVRLLREYFGPTLAAAENANTVALAAAAVDTSTKSVDLEPGALLSKQLKVLKSKGKDDGTSRTSKQDNQSQENLDVSAKKQEDFSILRCYRLMCRTLQAISLLDILLSVSEENRVDIPWGTLNGVSFCNIVINSNVQSRIKSMVHKVVEKMPAASAESLILSIDSRAFMYFSVGDRLAFEASKILDSVHDLGGANDTEAQKDALVSKGVNLVLEACSYWRSKECVQSSGTSAKLYDFCSKLRSIGTIACYDGIVDLVLKTADNYRTTNQDSVTLEEGSHRLVEVITGERNLYHGGGSPVGSKQDREIFRSLCYEALISCVRDLLSSEKDGLGSGVRQISGSCGPGGASFGIAFRMVTRATASSDDIQFHEMVYSCLLQDNRDMLIRLNSRFIEKFLLEEDPYLTYSYYTFHGMYTKAALLMDLQAQNQGDGIPLERRVQDLSRAVSSAQRAVAASREAHGSATTELETLVQLEEKLEVAELQRLVLSSLSSKLKLISDLPEDELTAEEESLRSNLEDVVGRLSDRLWSVSDLYNQATEPYELWDMSLIILHTCKHDDVELIYKLWLSVIYRITPVNSRNIVVQKCLDEKAKFFMRPIRRSLKNSYFEDSPSSWLKDLQIMIVDLGSHLTRSSSTVWSTGGVEGSSLKSSRGSGIPPSFPVALLIEELEEIGTLLRIVLETGETGTYYVERAWVAKCLGNVGISHMALVEAYIDVLKAGQGKSDEKKLQLLSSVSFVMLEWTKVLSEYSASKNLESRQLLMTARTGKFRSWIEIIGQSISKLMGSTRVISSNTSSAHFTRVLDDLRADVAEADHRVRSHLLS